MSALLEASQVQVLGLESPDALGLFEAHDLSRAHLKRAVTRFQQIEGVRIGTWIGVDDRGFIGATRRGWRPSQPGAVDEFLILITWDRLRQLRHRSVRATLLRSIKRWGTHS